ncbi:MAG: FixH family protein [Leptospiraceae bacterium]|nr:FixH family protein [Leptospiraceae bacterium]MCB1322563.1 FixH family protein [Leptospiraceae bacterium]
MTHGNKNLLKWFGGAAALFSTLLIALAFKFYYALSTNEPVMTENYYEVGLNYDEYRARHANSPDRLLSGTVLQDKDARLNRGANEFNFVYQKKDNRENAPLSGAKINLRFTRPATVNQDIEGNCVTDQTGSCRIALQIGGMGYWQIIATAEDAEGGRYTARSGAMVY